MWTAIDERLERGAEDKEVCVHGECVIVGRVLRTRLPGRYARKQRCGLAIAASRCWGANCEDSRCSKGGFRKPETHVL